MNSASTESRIQGGRTPDELPAQRLLYVMGGFAQIGGIERFTRDLLVELAPWMPRRTMVYWGHAAHRNRFLRELGDSGVELVRSRWRWGCRWSIPDRILWRQIRRALPQADMVVVSKGQSPRFFEEVEAARRRTGRRIPIILPTPYRPVEYWGPNPSPALLNAYDLIITQTEIFRNDLLGMGFGNAIAVIPLIPPEVTRLVRLPQAPPLKIGFLGRLERQKNLSYLLECFAALRCGPTDLPPVELHIFGDGSERQALEAWVRGHGISGQVQFHGAQPPDKVFACIDSCHLFASTSITEGQNLTALEILSRGRPFIATPVGAHPELLSDPALGAVAPLNDAAAYVRVLADWLGRLARSEIAPEDIAQRYGQKFSRPRVIRQYVDCFASLLGSAR